MEKISVTIITLNEEHNIRDALESVKWADEIILLDSGSSDRTIEICNEYTDKVFFNPWPGHISQKNLAMEKATGSWILSIDADERVTPELAQEIRYILKSPSFDAYAIPRHVFYLGKWINHSGWYPDYKIRLLKRGVGSWGGVNPHDKIIVKCKVGYLNGDLLHYSYRDICQHVQTMNNFTDIAAHEFVKSDRRNVLINMTFGPFWMFFKKMILKKGFMDGIPGFIIAISSSYYVFLKYAKIWELKNRLSRNRKAE